MNNSLEFTLEEIQQFNSLKEKAQNIADKYFKYQRKFGRLAGSVFDGGFYNEMDYKKMTTEEYKEFQELEKQMIYAEKMLKDISRR